MNDTLNYCTLFNSAYLTRGLAMYQSLSNTCSNFHLYVFAFDDATFDYFHFASLPNLTVISLNDFEDESLLRVKPTRTAGEYCWTATSSTILHCLEKFNLSHCAYIDADMIFYSDPRVLNEELSSSSVLITEHRYTPEYDQSATSGIYCVQYVLFKNDEAGMKVLRWWRDACIEWCFNRHENGKFGDQKYLDDWTTKFEGVHVLEHLGGGIAPWNLQQFNLLRENGNLFVQEKKTGLKQLLIFFHFHGLRFYAGDTVELTGSGYAVGSVWKKFLFKPYVLNLLGIGDELMLRESKITNPNGVSTASRPTHFVNSVLIFRENLMNYLRFMLGRIPQFRRADNHIYHKSEL
jgi:hypothetical protein